MLAPLLALVDLNGSAAAQAHRRLDVRITPPASRVVVAVRRCGPYRQGIWIASNWERRHGRRVWMGGRWVRANRGPLWIGGHWRDTPGGWEWIPGHW